MTQYKTQDNNNIGSEVKVQLNDLSKDEIHHILSNSRRRAVINELREESPQTQRQLVDNVTKREFQKDISRVHSSERKRVHVSLYQCHLPKLRNHGIIKGNDPIELDDNIDCLRPYLNVEQSESILQKWL